jgi:hypothetical protein
LALPTARQRSAELGTMVGMVDKAMCEGALGLSTGLFYAPQSYAKRDEVVTLAKAAAARGGIYDSHIRDESSYTIGLKGAIEEALSVGRDAKIPVHIAHIKALGVDVHGQAPAIIAQIEAAQKAGQIVHADQYPWSASGTGLSAALLPRWAQDGGRTEMLKRFDDSADDGADARGNDRESPPSGRSGVAADHVGTCRVRRQDARTDCEGPRDRCRRRRGADPETARSGGRVLQSGRRRYRRLHEAAHGSSQVRTRRRATPAIMRRSRENMRPMSRTRGSSTLALSSSRAALRRRGCSGWRGGASSRRAPSPT